MRTRPLINSLLACTLWLLATNLYAHESRPAYLAITERSADTYALLWKVPARGPGQRLALDLVLPTDVTVVEPARQVFTGNAFVERSVIRRRQGIDGAAITVEGLARTLTDVLVRIERLDGSRGVVRLTPAATSFVVASTPDTLLVARTYLLLGIEHIWQGIDHLLFIACLVAIAGTPRRILITITGFTIAHSLTLALAALDWVRLPVPPVEATIALSIVFLAREILMTRRDSLTWRYPITVSASFGLLHGFGFASALGEMGLPPTEIPAALLTFNIGVEIGQIVFVAALLCVGWLAARSVAQLSQAWQRATWQRYSEQLLALAIGSVAMLWTFERVGAFWS